MKGVGPSVYGRPCFLEAAQMKATGITAEFDPLHNGHAYLMEEARRLTGCDALVIAMSGDFVQRGEPALTDKWGRTEAALSSGADLVIEIPALFCLGNASQYAKASVRLLEAAGCSQIAFGSESGDAGLIERTAGNIKDMGGALEKEISVLAKQGFSFPAARYRAYASLRQGKASVDETESELSVLSGPNDILALEYVMNMKNALPVAVKRKGAPHSGGGPDSEISRSASDIRRFLSERRGEDSVLSDRLSEWMPASSVSVLSGGPLTFRDDWTGVLRYAVMSSDPAFLEDCPSGGEGLGRLLKKAAHAGGSFDGIVSAVKSKRYTYTRISRLCMQAILGISRTKYPYSAPAYIRVLGFSERGREFLSELKDDSSRGMPVITNINKEEHRLSEDARMMLALDIHASDIYNLMTCRDTLSDSDHVRNPVMTGIGQTHSQKDHHDKRSIDKE